MKRLILVVMFLCSLALAQDKPRVFVQGKGSEDVSSSGSGGGGRHWGAWGSKSAIDSHDESMEVTKDLQKNCSGVVVTLNQQNADYTIMLNRESKQNRGLLRSNSQVQVANREGDVLGTSATHTVGNAAKDACQLVVADWSQHGRSATQDASAQATQSARGAKLENASAVQAQTSTGTVVSPSGDDGEDGNAAAKRAKQHQACLALAKDNPSIVCK